jgi:HSP20 family protein
MQSQALSAKKTPVVTEITLDDLFKHMSEWSNRIAKRAYDFFAASGFTNGHDLEDWFKAERELLKPVALEVKEAPDEFIIKVEMPGFNADDLNIEVNGSHVIIEGSHEIHDDKHEKEQTIQPERSCAQVYRSIELPTQVLADSAKAALKNGVLELKLPKAAKGKLTKIAAA